MGFWHYEIHSFLKIPPKIAELVTLILSTPSINLFPFPHCLHPLKPNPYTWLNPL